MPWKVGVKDNKGFQIKRADTGKVVGHSKTREKAQASVRARYANTKGEGFGGRGGSAANRGF